MDALVIGSGIGGQFGRHLARLTGGRLEFASTGGGRAGPVEDPARLTRRPL